MALRLLTSGESHGYGLVVILEGIPAGVPVSTEAVAAELARRRAGAGRGPRMAIEADRVRIVGGVRHGRTLGSPFSALVENSEFEEKWALTMSPDPVGEGGHFDVEQGIGGGSGGGDRNSPALTQPRPGHADLVGMLKYGFEDARNVLERSSARETAARVVAGTVCKAFLGELGIRVVSHTREIAGIRSGVDPEGPESFEGIEEDPVRCLDPEASKLMVEAIEAANEEGDTVGGVFEVVVYGLPPGLGSYVHWDRRLDSRLAAAVMGINAVKGVEIGDGFEQARSRGSRAHDEITWASDASLEASGDRASSGREGSAPGPGAPWIPLARSSNRAGGLEGGVTTGQPLVVRGAMKPLSSLRKPLRTVDLATGAEAEAFRQRTDTCAVPAAGVVAEAMVAYVLADACLEKFGGDSLGEVKRAYASYVESVVERLQRARASASKAEASAAEQR